MEVCGTHTAAIFRHGLRSLLPSAIRLIAGPGCPVCVTPAGYIDRCVGYALRPGHALACFGDMMKVPGTGVAGRGMSLAAARGEGGRVELIYSPFEIVGKAAAEPETTFVLAAVGFETTAPAFGLLMDELIENNIRNVKLLCALKRAMPAIEWVCENEPAVDGFICPGHVSVITGSKVYEPLAAQYGKPFAIAGFEAAHLVNAIYALIKFCEGAETCSVHVYGESGAANILPNNPDKAPVPVAIEADREVCREHLYEVIAPRLVPVPIKADSEARSALAEAQPALSDAVSNFYGEAVHEEGNLAAKAVTEKYFRTGAAVWRGLGVIPDSGHYLKGAYEMFDAGSDGLSETEILQEGCRCADVITGRIDPPGCPLFGTSCKPEAPFGPCMVSAEGACGVWFQNSGLM